MQNSLKSDQFGLYIHWPFCAAKCPYCDFNSHVSVSIDQEMWRKAYVREIERLRHTLGARTITSLFFGGGTPSLMPPHTVDAIIAAAQQNFAFANDIEITLEANPTSSESQKFQDFRLAGVNRVSIGVQSLRDADLHALGRQHSAQEALRTISMARDIFQSVSFDMMYGRQNQSLNDWTTELNEALALDPDHISLYQLTIEASTRFGALYDRGKLRGLPDEDLSYSLFEATQTLCDQHGLMQYEVSNFAKDGHQSRHNRTYWTYAEYAGLGPGAHGRVIIDDHVFATETELSPSKWLSLASQDKDDPTYISSTITAEDQATEMLLMGLRLWEGVDHHRWTLAQPYINQNKAALLVQDGLLSINGQSVHLTAQGRPLLNAILSELLT